MGLKKADPSRLKELLPKRDRSLAPEVIQSHIQKLRSFRYQMRNTLGGDNLDTVDELAQKGILSNGARELGMSLEHHREGSFSLARGRSESGDGVNMDVRIGADGLPNLGLDGLGAFEVPTEFASAIERLDGPQMKRSVELMGQCVQVQRSAHGVLMHAIETQEALKAAIMDKVRQMGLPSVSSDGAPGASEAEAAQGQLFGRPAAPSQDIAGDNSNSNNGSNNGLLPDPPKLPSASLSREGNGSLADFATNRRVSASISLAGGGSSSSVSRTPAPPRPTAISVQGMGTYAGVASMLQASAQSMQLPLPTSLPPKRGAGLASVPGALGSTNLFSFVPTATAAAAVASTAKANSPNPNVRASSSSTPPAGAASTTSDPNASAAPTPSPAGAAAAAPPPPPPPTAAATAPSPTAGAGVGAGSETVSEEAAAAAASVASALASVLASGAGGGMFGGGAPSSREAGAGLGLGLGLEGGLGDYWDSGVLDGAGGGGSGGVEALDETSLRMEMKTSMDMHRLMRSRQKNQLQLHTQQQRQEMQQQEGSVAMGTASVNSTHSTSGGGAGAGPGVFPLPVPRNALSTSDENEPAASTQQQEGGQGQAAVSAGAAAPSSSLSSTSTSTSTSTSKSAAGATATATATATVARPKDAPLPAPPPAEGVGSSTNTSNVMVQEGIITPRSDGDTPNLMNADWNWDEDTLDAQLFSFLLDTPPPG